MVQARILTLSVAVITTLVIAEAFTPDPNKRYKLRTKFQGPNKCLEGNRFDSKATLKGAAFMDTCQSVTGQMWKFVPQNNGYYRTKTVFQGPNKCLEGNKFAACIMLGGAAFMDDCKSVSGQLWKIVRRGKYFTLTTVFRVPFNECLEGNKLDKDSTLGGAAFMSKFRPFSGTLFEAKHA